MTAAGDGRLAYFGLLGPLSVAVEGTQVVIGAAKVRIVLATLLLRSHRPVPLHELATHLWAGASPPDGARNAVQAYVMRLRKKLGPAGDLIVTESAGYRIDLSGCIVDVQVFQEHLRRARTARNGGDRATESAELSAGLALWRDQPLLDVPSETLHLHDVPELVETRLQAVERRLDLDIELGRHADLVAELQTLTTEHRLRERFWGQLMLALSGTGRRAEALQVYGRISAVLREELGLDPGTQLQEIHRRILSGDTGSTVADGPGADHGVGSGAAAPPFQVPADVPDFTGRAELVERIRALVEAGGDSTGAWVPIVTLSGPPGVGKSALAIHTAHQVRARFPDGQLYVQLRGHAGVSPMTANEALDLLLRALGAAPETLPPDVDGRSALIRSMLSGRRVLLVLDDARSAEQVRPLLPGGGRSAVIVTSRSNLSGLHALNGASRVTVPPVSAAEAVQLLTALVGSRRVRAEPAAVERLVDSCGGLPLALRIVAANLAADEGDSIASAVERLLRDRLGSLVVVGDEDAAVQRAFDLSCDTLDPAAARLFQLLSLVPGTSFDAHVAAAVAAASPAEARSMLVTLTDANLIHARPAGRAQFHDLVRDYARDRAGQLDGSETGAAFGRLFDHYLHTAHTACRAAYPDLVPGVPAPAVPAGVAPLRWDTPQDALQWLEAETDNVVAMITAEDRVPGRPPIWRLAITLLSHFLRQRRDVAWQAAFTRSLAHAEDADPLERAALHSGLGLLHFLRGEHDSARTSYENALAQSRIVDDLPGQADAHYDLGALAAAAGRYTDAIRSYESGLAALPSSDVVGRINALIDLGLARTMIGDVDRATRLLDEALTLSGPVGLRHLTARATSAIAWGQLTAGRLDSAEQGFSHALAIWTELGYGPPTAMTLRNLAETHFEAGRFAASHDLARRALSLAEEVGDKWTIVGSYTTLAALHQRRGDVDRALPLLEQARDGASAGLRFWYPSATLVMSECFRRLGATDRATALADEVIGDARPQMRGRGHAERARIALELGDLDRCVDDARSACRVAARWGYRLDEARAAELVGEAYRRQGRTGRALEHFSLARDRYGEENVMDASRVGKIVELLRAPLG